MADHPGSDESFRSRGLSTSGRSRSSRTAERRLHDVGQPDVDTADPYRIGVAGRVELVAGLGFRGRLGHADELLAVEDPQAHGQLGETSVGTYPSHADEELRHAVFHD